MALKTETVELKVPGESKPMTGYWAVPDGPGPHAAVIVIEEIFGINSHIRHVTERIARLGYVALAPDIHHRTAPGIELGYDAEGTQRGIQLIPKRATYNPRAAADAWQRVQRLFAEELGR